MKSEANWAKHCSNSLTWPVEKHPVLGTMTLCLGHGTVTCVWLPRIVCIMEGDLKSLCHAKQFLHYRLENMYLLKPLRLRIFKILSYFCGTAQRELGISSAYTNMTSQSTSLKQLSATGVRGASTESRKLNMEISPFWKHWNSHRSSSHETTFCPIDTTAI